MTTRRSASNVKVLHSGYTFTGSESFPSGILPTKCQVLERIIQFENFGTVDVANDVAKEIHDRWVWCNVYPLPEVGSTELFLYRITEPNYFFCTGTGTDRYF